MISFEDVKNEDAKVKEKLIESWIQMSVSFRGNRMLTKLSVNEIVICNILYSAKKQEKELITATDICNLTKIYKSQINRILTSMERKNLIERVRCEEDKRKIYIKLKEDAIYIYEEQHDIIMEMLDAVYKKLGRDKAEMLALLMAEATEAVNEND